jgi:hypothetical protein
MNKIKLKKLSADARKDLYIHYFLLFNDFYIDLNTLSERKVLRHYQQIRTRFKRLKSVMSKEEIDKITFTAG